MIAPYELAASEVDSLLLPCKASALPSAHEKPLAGSKFLSGGNISSPESPA